MPIFPPPAAGVGIRTATRVVASVNAPAHMKSAADSVCSGVDDDIEINAAISGGGTVVLVGGDFTIGDYIDLVSDLTLIFEGGARIVKENNYNVTPPDPPFGSSNPAIVGYNKTNIRIYNSWTDGNRVNQADWSGQHGMIFSGCSYIWVENPKADNENGGSGIYFHKQNKYYWVINPIVTFCRNAGCDNYDNRNGYGWGKWINPIVIGGGGADYLYGILVSDCDNVEIINPYVYNVKSCGIWLQEITVNQGSRWSKVVGGLIDTVNYDHGIRVDGDDNMVLGPNIRNVNDIGLRIGVTASRTKIRGVTFENNGTDYLDQGDETEADFQHFHNIDKYFVEEKWQTDPEDAASPWTVDKIGTADIYVWALGRLDLETGNTSGSSLRLYTNPVAAVSAAAYSKVTWFTQWAGTDRTTSTVILALFPYNCAVPPSLTDQHYGFKIINGAIWATNANGTTETATDTGITYSSAWDSHVLSAKVYNGGIRYYVDGVLKATHTTNIPSFTSSRIYHSLTNDATGDRKFMLQGTQMQKD